MQNILKNIKITITIIKIYCIKKIDLQCTHPQNPRNVQTLTLN